MQTVLDQFWVLTGEGWVNKRALEEIEKAAIQAEKNLIIALAREAKKRSIRDKHEQSTKRSTKRATKRSTNVQPIHSHSHSQIPDTRSKAKTKEKEESSELPAADALMLLPTNKTGVSYPVSQAKRDEYHESYPGIDVNQQLRKARQWLIDNRTRRKTLKGMPTFLNRWMSNAQDKPKPRPAADPKTYNDRLELAERQAEQMKKEGKI